MRRAIPAFLILAAAINGTVVLDRVAVIVGQRVVKSSDIERDLQVAQFLNRQQPDLSPGARRTSAARLIDQEIIRQEILNGEYGEPADTDVNAYLLQLRRDRFNDSDTQFRAALSRYKLSEDVLRRHVRWQLTVLRFIDQRFRPGVLVTDEDVSAYYEQHRGELEKAYPKDSRLEAVAPQIRETLTGERVNQHFEEWLEQRRKTTRIEFREAAFAGGSPQ
jgi:peptidyl-prolyl cis-trans isomerase SurA